ncbi:hypothetical protein QC760_006446 [Botrytis cinerea]
MPKDILHVESIDLTVLKPLASNPMISINDKRPSPNGQKKLNNKILHLHLNLISEQSSKGFFEFFFLCEFPNTVIVQMMNSLFRCTRVENVETDLNSISM